MLTKQELISALQNELRVLLHLLSKVDPAHLAYRPTPNQRSMIELIQYLAIMPPIHTRAIMAGSFDMDAWKQAWRSGEAAAAAMDLDEATQAIAKHTELFTELLGPRDDADFAGDMEMFGMPGSRGSKLVSLVLCHYSAYRMQLFLYLKSCGHAELNTMNLWVGRDA